jgi:hypothetical protein
MFCRELKSLISRTQLCASMFYIIVAKYNSKKDDKCCFLLKSAVVKKHRQTDLCLCIISMQFIDKLKIGVGLDSIIAHHNLHFYL